MSVPRCRNRNFTFLLDCEEYEEVTQNQNFMQNTKPKQRLLISQYISVSSIINKRNLRQKKLYHKTLGQNKKENSSKPKDSTTQIKNKDCKWEPLQEQSFAYYWTGLDWSMRHADREIEMSASAAGPSYSPRKSH